MIIINRHKRKIINTYILSWKGDAKEVHQSNGWLTYGEPLHRLREFGAIMKELDLIDESTLSSEQMRAICASL